MNEMTRLPYDLSGHRVLITGACGGIGQATATLFARLGATLILTDQTEPPAGFLDGLAGGATRGMSTIIAMFGIAPPSRRCAPRSHPYMQRCSTLAYSTSPTGPTTHGKPICSPP